MMKYQKTNSLQMRHALLDISNGYPIIYHDSIADECYLIINAVNFLNYININSTTQNHYLVLPQERINEISDHEIKTNVQILINKNNINKINDLAYSLSKIDISNINIEESNNSIDDIIIKLFKHAEEIPSFIKVKITENNLNDFDNICIINTIIIKEYLNNRGDIQFIINTKIISKYSINSEMILFKDNYNRTHIAYLIHKDRINNDTAPIIRIHSECKTGDLFGSLTCDCGDQLEKSFELMSNSPSGGVLIYLNQDGRGIGLKNKLLSYQLQYKDMDTVEANLFLGFSRDERCFKVAYNILNYLKIKNIQLITNNPHKILAIEKQKINITKCLKLECIKNNYNKKYIDVKKNKLHI